MQDQGIGRYAVFCGLSPWFADGHLLPGHIFALSSCVCGCTSLCVQITSYKDTSYTGGEPILMV